MGNAHTTRNCYRTKTRNIWLQLSSMQSTKRERNATKDELMVNTTCAGYQSADQW